MAKKRAAAEAAPRRPYREVRRARLEALCEEVGGPAALMKATGVTDTHITACIKGRRGIGDDMAWSLEFGTRKPLGWLDEDPALRPWPFGDLVSVAEIQALKPTELSEVAGSINEALRRLRERRPAPALNQTPREREIEAQADRLAQEAGNPARRKRPQSAETPLSATHAGPASGKGTGRTR